MENYIECKKRVFNHQAEKDFVLLNADDPLVENLGTSAGGRVFYFSLEKNLASGVCLEEGKIVLRIDGQVETICSVEEVRLRGRHNLENILCAVGMTYLAGVPVEVIAAALRTFTGVRHRIEEAGFKDGVLYINDSKGTNPVSTIKALESFSEPILLIAGGYDKGTDFNDLVPYVKGKVKKLILLGATQEKIAQTMIRQGYPIEACVQVSSLTEAVQRAQEFALPGDIVLLSPACASWDMFRDYEERGDVFCRLVQELAQHA